MEKLRSLFNNKKFLSVLIILITVAVIKLVLGMIYVKDEPKIIPEKTREDIRGSIKEGIAVPLSRTIPAIGNPMVEAAFVDQTRQPTPQANTGTENWKTYENKEYGFSLKYPGEWVASGNNNVIIFKSSDIKNELGVYLYRTNENVDVFWEKGSGNIVANFVKEKELIINGIQTIQYKEVDGMEEVHYVFVKDGVGFDFLTLGSEDDEIIKVLQTIN